ncbi:MAG: hypothetical protein DMG29_06975 [Acidobacteria bacterium]|nr:MAG: hypothetical protein DMG29_06975 [Acidobacteriota bacterium]
MLALLRIDTVTWLSKKNDLMYWTMWNSSPVFGLWPKEGFQGVHAPPSSSSSPVGLNGLNEKPAFVEAAPGPCAIALKDRPCLIDDLTKCVWSSKTNRSAGALLSA